MNATLVSFGNGEEGYEDGIATLVFNHTADDYQFDPALGWSGLGTATIQVHAGTTILTADSSAYNSTTNIHGGTLLIDETGVLGGLINVMDGGTFGGKGTAGDVTVMAGGILAPGMSIGTMNVATADFDADSVFEVEVDATSADRLDVAGTANLAGTVHVVPLAGILDIVGNDHVILTANGITGSFAGATTDYAFLTPTLDYGTPDQVILSLSLIEGGFGGLGETPNQTATGDGVFSGGVVHPLFDRLLPMTVEEALAALDQLSGEIHPSLKTALVNDSQHVRDTLLDRAGLDEDCIAGNDAATGGRTPDTCRNIWAQGYGAWSTTESDGNAAGMTQSTGGILAGIDGKLGERFRLGFAGGWSRSDVDVDDRASSADIDSYHVAAYGGARFGMLNLRKGVSFAWHSIDTTRTGLDETLTAGYDATTLQLFSEAGLPFSPMQGTILEPFAGLAHVRVHTDGFTEIGGIEALTAQSDDEDVTFTTIGARFEGTSGGVTAHGMTGWRHTFGDLAPDTDFTFDGTDRFTTWGVPVAEDAFIAEAGLDLAITPNTSLGFAYAGQIARDAQTHSAEVNLIGGF